MRRGRVALAIVAVIVVTGALWFAQGAWGDADVPTVEVTVGDLAIVVDVEGTLASEDSTVLRPPGLGGVMYDFQISFMAPEGAALSPGEKALGFDTSELERQLAEQLNAREQADKNIEKLDFDQAQQMLQLELRLAEAEAALARAELKNEMPDELRSANAAVLAQLDVDLTAAEVESLQAQLQSTLDAGASKRAGQVAQRDSAAARVAGLQEAIARMDVTAPRAGTVIYVSNWRGEKRKVGDSVWRSEPIMEIPDLTRMFARGEVDEADAGRLAEGQPVRFRLDAHPDVGYGGRIRSIWRTVQRQRGSNNPVKVVRVEIELDTTDEQRMRPGMRFQGSIEVDRMTDAVLVPSSAAFPTPEGAVVYRRSAMSWLPVAVKLGARDRDHVQVLEGVAPGDRVAARRPSS